MSESEVAKFLYEGTKWGQVPIRRLKASANGLSSWLIGAEGPPAQMHARLGAVLITVEEFDDSQGKNKRPPRRQTNKANKENWGGDAAWHSYHADPVQWDPWAEASEHSRRTDSWKKQNHTQVNANTTSDAWSSYSGRVPTAGPQQPGAASTSVQTLEERVGRIEQVVTQRTEQLTKVEGRVVSVKKV
eukprot:6265471-Amphidinium_carterae.5